MASVAALVFLQGNPGRWMVYDDSYITLKFARNLLQLGRFTFDGIHAGGATSPLHVLLIALVSVVVGRVETATIVLGIMSLALGGIAMRLWAEQVSGERAIGIIAGLLFVSAGWMVFDALSGLETVLFIALLLFSLYLFERRNPVFGLPLALSIITRPDGWFFVAGLAVYAVVQQFRPERWQIYRLVIAIGIFAGSLLPYFVLNYLGTGSLLPNTVMAKANFFGEMIHPFSVRWQFLWSGVRYFYSQVIMMMPWLIVGALVLARRFWRCWYLFVALVIFYLLYLQLLPGGVGHYWFRYQHIFIPVVLLVLAEGAWRLFRLLSNVIEAYLAWQVEWRRPNLVAGAAVATLLTVNQTGTLIQEYHRYQDCVRHTASVGIGLARYIREHSQPGDAVASHDIGFLGYYSERPVIDLVGLVNPDAAALYRDPVTGRAQPFAERRTYWYLKAIAPRYLVMFADWSLFLHLAPDALPDDFRFVTQIGGYRIYEVTADQGDQSVPEMPGTKNEG